MKAFVCVLAVLVASCSAGFIGGRGGVAVGGGFAGGHSFGPPHGPIGPGPKLINVVHPQQPPVKVINVINQQPPVQVFNGAGYASGGHAYSVGYPGGIYSSGGAGGYYGGAVQVVQQPIAPVQHVKHIHVVQPQHIPVQHVQHVEHKHVHVVQPQPIPVQHVEHVVHQQLAPVQHVKHIQVVPQQLKTVEVIHQQAPPHVKTIQVVQGGGGAVHSGGYSYETAAPWGSSYVADGGVYGGSGFGALEAVKSFKSIGGQW